jgi:hypothetical protein
MTLAVGDTVVLDNQLPARPWDAHLTLHSALLEGSADAIVTFPVSVPVTTTKAAATRAQPCKPPGGSEATSSLPAG